MTPSPMMKRASSFLALFLLALAVLATIPDRVHSVPQSPVILGWGGSRLVENTLYSNTTVPSIVFPFENASDQEVAGPSKIPAVIIWAVPALDCRSKRHRLSSVGDCRTGREDRGQRKNGEYSDTLSRRCGAARRVVGS